jgi:SAM-dependent methyltransferase
MFTAATGYDRFMGRFSVPLAPVFADFAGIDAGQRVLDVGCGPGALLGELASRLGGDAVVGIEPSEGFAAAARERHPGVEVVQGAAEELPFADASFDAALAQLVVHFMRDPAAGLREMARVTKPGGTVAACVWDHAGRTGPLELFWSAARELEPDVNDESERFGTRQGQLEALFLEAGLLDVTEAKLTVEAAYDDFEDWWATFGLATGPAGAYVESLAPAERETLKSRCATRFAALDRPAVSGSAWAVRGRVA